MIPKIKHIDSNSHVFGKDRVGFLATYLAGGVCRDYDFNEPPNYFWAWFREGRVSAYSHDHYGIQE